ncbi:hypothetical protein FZC74_11995 [Sutcliffiella horikoshii]|uniref:Tripartite tricarboxylate transporter TctB family protein n=1 Tax=Sutcliffiella horikoshii TaxID=79883 RepID=A0AA94WRM0_9BACI|nr:hypothetical protein [Sutcliffiella horikoshii]TYS58522.1 hypothetical protein FZC74_11995 [Sutcliffiella horikoshii]
MKILLKNKLLQFCIASPISILLITTLCIMTPVFDLRYPKIVDLRDTVTLVSSAYFLSSFYVIPLTIITEIIFKKIPAGAKAFKFMLYIFWAFLFFLLFLIPTFGFSIFAFIPFLLLFIYEECKAKTIHKFYIVLSITSVIAIIIIYLVSIPLTRA